MCKHTHKTHTQKKSIEEIKVHEEDKKELWKYVFNTRWKNKHYFIHQQEAERKAQMNTKQMGQIENIYQDGIFRLHRTVPVTTSSVNWLNNSVKRQKLLGWIEKQDLLHAIWEKKVTLNIKT